MNKDLLPNHQSFFQRACKIFLAWFLLLVYPVNEDMRKQLLVEQTETRHSAINSRSHSFRITLVSYFRNSKQTQV